MPILNLSLSTQTQDALNRRLFLRHGSTTIGAAALATLINPGSTANAAPEHGLPLFPNHAPAAKRIIYLFQSGAPSQMDLFDPKPMLAERRGEDLPASIRQGQRLTTMTSGQSKFPVAPSIFKFAQHGECGMWMSDALTHMPTLSDKWCMIRSMHTEAINHDPAITFCQTGSQLAGRPSIGAWASYGLGSDNENLPSYVVLTSFGSGRPDDQPLYDRLWGSGFLPSKHQGVKFRNSGDAVLYLSNPPGIESSQRREMLDDLSQLNSLRAAELGDPETLARIHAYEMAYRMQTSVPELTDISQESAATLEAYGPEVLKPGSYAANCLLARRLLQRDVRFVQLFHRGWDQHIALGRQLPNQCRDIDQPTAALIKDLKQNGLLEDTLVVFATEFGRTVFSQGKLGDPGMGRDHHGRSFTVWLAGGGIRGGMEYGATDDFCYNIVDKPVHLRDLHATILHCMGIDHSRFTYKFRGLNTRLTGVEEANVVTDILT